MPIRIKNYKLSDEQESAVNPSSNAWVQANAGAGKTEILAGRLLRILFRYKQQGKDITKIPGILCLTYTETGVGEMKDRVVKTFRKWAMACEEDLREAISFIVEGQSVTDNDVKVARQIFFDVIDNPDILKIRTIHSFCSDILKQFSLEAGLPPAWSVISDYNQRVLLEKTFEKMINNPNMNSQVREALHNVMSVQTETAMDEIYRILVKKYKAIFAIKDKKDYRNYFKEQIDKYLNIDDTANVPAKPEDLDEMIQKLQDIAQTQEDENIKHFYTGLCKKIETFKSDQKRNFAEYKTLFLNGAEIKYKTFKDVKMVDGTNKRIAYIKMHPDIFLAEAERVKRLSEYNAKYKLHTDTMSMFELVLEFEKLYKKTKREYNVLDFDDLILYTTKLFENPVTVGAVLQQLSGSVGHILVDEAQDTSLQQWQIFNTLRDNIVLNGDFTSLVVGDSKQAIFGFQDADTKAFIDNRADFEKRTKETGNSFSGVDLTLNFRSLAPVLNTVDYFFNKFKKDDNQQDGAEINVKFVNSKHISFRSDRLNEKGGLVEINKAFIPNSSGEAGKKEYAEYLAEKIENVLKTEKVYKDGKLCDITPDDIMILVRKRSVVVSHLLHLLKDKGIEVAGEDKIVLNDFLPVRDLLNLIRFSIKHKKYGYYSDDYTLGCILKSPLYRLSESQIYDLCEEAQSSDEKPASGFMWKLLEEHYPEIYKDLSEILARCKTDAPYTFFNYVLSKKFRPDDEMNNRQKIISAMGKHIIDPLEDFLTLCLVYERTQSGTPKDFLKWFVTSETAVKRDVKSAHGVKVMTVHGSKGLEAPVVFLIDTFNKGNKNFDLFDLNFKNPPEKQLYDLWMWKTVPLSDLPANIAQDKKDYSDKEILEEYYRLLYVAMTRARDQLYIYGQTNTKPKEDADKEEKLGEWYPVLWRKLSDIAVALPNTATKDTLTQEIEKIRITDDPEIKEFFESKI